MKLSAGAAQTVRAMQEPPLSNVHELIRSGPGGRTSVHDLAASAQLNLISPDLLTRERLMGPDAKGVPPTPAMSID